MLIRRFASITDHHCPKPCSRKNALTQAHVTRTRTTRCNSNQRAVRRQLLYKCHFSKSTDARNGVNRSIGNGLIVLGSMNRCTNGKYRVKMLCFQCCRCKGINALRAPRLCTADDGL